MVPRPTITDLEPVKSNREEVNKVRDSLIGVPKPEKRSLLSRIFGIRDNLISASKKAQEIAAAAPEEIVVEPVTPIFSELELPGTMKQLLDMVKIHELKYKVSCNAFFFANIGIYKSNFGNQYRIMLTDNLTGEAKVALYDDYSEIHSYLEGFLDGLTRGEK